MIYPGKSSIITAIYNGLHYFISTSFSLEEGFHNERYRLQFLWNLEYSSHFKSVNKEKRKSSWLNAHINQVA